MVKIQDIFIDFDDTLYDTHGNAEIALRELFDEFHWERYFERVEDFTVPYWQTNIELWGQYARGEIERDFLIIERFRRPLSEGHNLSPTPEYCLQVSDRFLDLCKVKPHVIKGAHSLMDHLRKRGYRLHMCSNGFREVQGAKLRASGLYDCFDTIILSEDAGVNKPHPDFFRYAFRLTGARPETTLMIGDNLETDIRGAREAGMQTIYFCPDPHEAPPAEIADYTVRTLAEIQQIL